MLWHVAILSPPYSTLSYTVPEYFPKNVWQIGQRVCVPLTKNLRCGILLFADTESHNWGKENNYKLKSIFWPLEKEPLLQSFYLNMVVELAHRQLKTCGEVLANVLPANLRKLNHVFEVKDEMFPKRLKLTQLKELNSEKLTLLAKLWCQGKVLKLNKPQEKQEKVCVISKDPPWPVRSQATNQLKLLEYIWENRNQTRQSLVNNLGSWVISTLRLLEKKGLILWQKSRAFSNNICKDNVELRDFQLSAEQKQALSSLLYALEKNQAAVQLLYGVTGSGKTLIYMYLVKRCLELGLSVLFLLPEVALAMQVWSEIKKYFYNFDCYLYHGYQSPTYREQVFETVALKKNPCLVVGTRSAVFLPRKDWGMVILDEEHDVSFKQEERFCYHAKEASFYLINKNNGLLVLGSATPDIKTFYSAKQGLISMQKMKHRVSQHELPRVELIDLQKESVNEGPLCESAHTQLQECLNRGEQAIILLNRRGYAPLVFCTSCKQVLKCDYCEVGMTYYKKREKVICHYCGLSKPFPLACPKCGAFQYVPISEGTEQVEEYLANKLEPDTKVLRLDRDSTRRQGSMEDILKRFSERQAKILVGTQMCSKGHHFPDVTLVIVVDGDVGLNLPDYRATERTFQLLVQVAGRAGRGDKPGQVIIQTRNPSHYCWHYVQENDYEGFYEQEIILRRRLGYPPFVKLGLLRMSFPADWSLGIDKVNKIADILRQKGRNEGVKILGPAPAPLNQLRGRLRYQCLLKANQWQHIRQVCAHVLQNKSSHHQFRIQLDLDPLQLL